MSQGGYRVSVVLRPDGWEAASLDDSPDELRCLDDIGTHDKLEDAVEQVLDFNRQAVSEGSEHWAVAFETPPRGRSSFRVCTPLTYRLVHVHWPDGWEPKEPLDVPPSAWREQSDTQQEFSFDEALDALRSLNEAHMAEPTSQRWSIMVAVECEPLHTSTYCDHLGTETSISVRRLHVVRPLGDGDSHRLFQTVRD